MKTAKSATLAKKIEKLVLAKELNRNSLVYGWVNQIVKGETEFRPVFSQGGSLVDKTTEFEKVLIKLGLSFSTSNDAPRGGKKGVRIDLLTKVK